MKDLYPCRNIEKLYRRAISSKNNTAAGFREIDKTTSVAGQLSVYQLDVSLDVGMLQRFGKRNVSAQNAVAENFRVKKLRRFCEKDRWKVECHIQRRELKSVPIRPDSKRKISCEAYRGGIGHVDHATYIPLAGIDRSLNVSWNWGSFFRCSARNRQVFEQIIQSGFERP